MKKFAVFDIDGTLYRWQLYHELVQTLALEGVFSKNAFEEIDDKWNQWRGGELSFDEYEQFVVAVMIGDLSRVPTPTFEAACDKVIKHSAHKVHHYPKVLLKQLKEQGYTIIAITGSQQELIDRFAKKYGIDIAIGALYERSGDHFTGNITRPTMGRKQQLLEELVRQHNLTFEGSVAIGDSDGDAELLEQVERPIAFNPSAGLFERAQKDGWSIVIERKNIAYRMEKDHDRLILAETIIY